MTDEAKETTTEIVSVDPTETETGLAVQRGYELDFFMQESKFKHIQRVAQMFASSELVPDNYKGKVADCTIILSMALRHNADPMAFFNGVYIIKGKPAMEAKLGIALANKAEVFAHPILYDLTGSGEAMQCRAYTKMADTGTDIEMTVSMAMAKKEGWTKNPKWSSMPELMLRYRSAMFLIRAYAPEVLYGMSTNDEAREMAARPVVVEVADDIRSKIAKKRAELPAGTSTVATVEAGVDVDDLGQKDAEEAKPTAKPKRASKSKPKQKPKKAEPETETEPDDENPFPLSDGEAIDKETGEIKSEPEPEPEPEDDGTQNTQASIEKERQDLVANYIDLCQATGNEPKKINRLTNATLKKHVAAMTEQLKGD
jgi:hypothetical protein